MLPFITVDDSKCGVALDCRLCLLACPSHVLGLGTNVGPKKYQETDPSRFIVRGVRFQLCTVCGKCEEVCPHGAIEVSFDQGATG